MVLIVHDRPYETNLTSDGKYDYIINKNEICNKREQYNPETSDIIAESIYDYNSILRIYNLSEDLLDKLFLTFSESIIKYQKISDDFVIKKSGAINWEIYLTYNLLSEKVLNILYNKIPKYVLEKDINIRNKIILQNHQST
jgi:hypothetical protein